jgi:cyclohexanone monooxygenase
MASSERPADDTTVDDISVDVVALRQRYADERDRRMQARAAAQAAQPELKGRFSQLDRDYYAKALVTRPALIEEIDVAVIGGGLGGLMVSARLRQQGVTDLRLIEKGGDFGGTWYWNRYPGAFCDVESYIYLPLLEETGYMPAQRYSKASEIRSYLQTLATRFDLYKSALFQTTVTGLRWSDERCRWIVQTSRGDRIAARFLVSCTGVLSNPKLPNIAGIDTFRGHSFHTSRWDFAYTGGDEDGDLAGLADKRVGIIGTGATALQVVPKVAASARELYVFQRTPSSVDERGNRATDPQWFKSLSPGWQSERIRNFSSQLSGVHEPVDLIQDGWTDIVRSVAPPAGGAAPDPAQLELAGFRKMEMTRRRIDQFVRDKVTAEALKPYYHYFCKRPGFHDEYLSAFNQSNVKLVDTRGRGVTRITPAGAIVDGREYPLDCFIYATGFDFLTDQTREAGFDIHGRGGIALGEHWREGPRTLYAVQTDQFPNLFFIRLSQAGNSPNFTHLVGEQSDYIAHIIGKVRAAGAETVEATPEAVDAWVQEVIDKAAPRRAFLATCTPGQYNHEGDAGKERFALLNELYGGGPIAYFEILRTLQQHGELKGLRVS